MNLFYTFSRVSDGNMSFVWGDRKDVISNRKKFLTRMGLTFDDCVAMKIQDADYIDEVSSKEAGSGMAETESAVLTDALITKDQNLCLFLVIADCLPIIFYDHENNALGLAHLSWKSTETKLSQKVVTKMKSKFGSKPESLKIVIGPGIRKESYIFKDPIQLTMPEWKPYLGLLPNGETSIDLVGYNKAQLKNAGVLEENIQDLNLNTAIEPTLFSHYRSKRTGEPEGRFAAIAVLKK